MEAIEGDCYCSKSCSSFTQQLAAQLVNPMDRIKPSALHKALEAPSHKPQKPQQQGVGAQGGGVTTMKSVIEVSCCCRWVGSLSGWLLAPEPVNASQLLCNVQHIVPGWRRRLCMHMLYWCDTSAGSAS